MDEMHEYKITGKKFYLVNLGIWAFSLIFAYIIHIVVSLIECKCDISLWIIEIPSIIGVYEKANKYINKYLWSKLYKIKDLSGKWEGCLQTSFDNYNSNLEATCIIKQDFDKISIMFETENSISYSTKAILHFNSSDEITLDYDYINIPKMKKLENLNIHFGHNTFKLKNNELHGEYYNKHRETKGEIVLKKREEN